MNNTYFTSSELEILRHITQYTLISAYQEYDFDSVKAVVIKLGLKWHGKGEL